MRAAAVLLGAVGTALGYLIPPAHLTSAPYAPWAHSHFVWLDSSQSNQANVSAYIADYAAHNITVGGLDIDSEWSTGNNNFIVDTSKFPDMAGLVANMHNQGINVILWMTSMVDTDSSNFGPPMNNSYFIKDGYNQTALLKWWHGTGGLIDYTNPEGKAWWEGQLDAALSLGIDGWKADGTDPYIIELVTPIGYSGYLTAREYSDAYYGHTFNYTRQVNGAHCLVWSRPVDSYPISILNLSAFLEFSPKYEMASGWVGDQDPTFYGMKMALINILESGWQGYANFGSDTGGYRSGQRTADLLLRWAQLNAFLPLFENGGNDEHRAWMYDAPGSTTYADIYRRLVAAHYELGPYLLSTGTAALLNGSSVITPMSAPPVDFPFLVQPDMLTDYSYMLGEDYFVSPIVEANVSVWPIHLPGTSADRWFEFWNVSSTHAGNSSFLYTCPLSVVPVFVRSGSLLPLHVSTPHGLVPSGDWSYASALTLLIHTPRADTAVARSVHDWNNGGVQVSYTCNSGAGTLTLAASAYERDIIVIVRNVAINSTAEVSLSAEGSSDDLQVASYVLKRVSPAPAIDSAHADIALDWEGAGPAPRLSRPAVSAQIKAQAGARAMTWSYAAATPTQVSELVVRAGSASAGVIATITGVACL